MPIVSLAEESKESTVATVSPVCTVAVSPVKRSTGSDSNTSLHFSMCSPGGNSFVSFGSVSVCGQESPKQKRDRWVSLIVLYPGRTFGSFY